MSIKAKISFATKAVLSGVLLASSPFAQAVVDKGLMAYYCFDDASNLGKDCSVNGNNGTVEGGTVVAAPGYRGTGALFGGFYNPAAIHVPNSPSLQIVQTAANFYRDFSVAFAVKLTGYDGMDIHGNYADFGVHAIVAKSHEWKGMAIYVDSDVQIGAAFSGAYVPRTQLPNYGILQKWVHFTYIFSNSKHNVKLYANGNLIAIKNGFTQNFGIMNEEDLYLGKYSDAWFPLNGTLDEVRLYNRSLTDAEIKTLSNQGGAVGGVAKHLSPYAVTCKNKTTGQVVKIPAKEETVYDCEANGLVVKPSDLITTTINGNAQ